MKKAKLFYEEWQQSDLTKVVKAILQNQELWGSDLTALPGFYEAVTNYLVQINEAGIEKTLQVVVLKKNAAS